MSTAAPQHLSPAESTGFPIPAGVHAERVVSVRHYTDRLFGFRITRPQSFRFRSGEFVMIGLPNAATGIFQAMMLFFLLAGDIFVRYRIRRVAPAAEVRA